MNEEYIKDKYDFKDLTDIVHRLRMPDGCPWDSRQTYESLRECVTNEAAEVVGAVDNKDVINLKEELGDLLLQVVFYADIAAQYGDFELEDVIDGIAKKMIRRHPHIFGDEAAGEQYKDITDKGISLWNAVKLKEKKERLEEYERLYTQGRITGELLANQREHYENFLRKTGLDTF